MKRVISTLLVGMAAAGATLVATAPGAIADPPPGAPVTVTVDGPADGDGTQVDVGIRTHRLNGRVSVDTGNEDGPLAITMMEHGSW
jgi:hypothetical protein